MDYITDYTTKTLIDSIMDYSKDCIMDFILEYIMDYHGLHDYRIRMCAAVDEKIASTSRIHPPIPADMLPIASCSLLPT